MEDDGLLYSVLCFQDLEVYSLVQNSAQVQKMEDSYGTQ